MGIDIYAKWRGQINSEAKAQITGFDTTAGSKGYLREAYHGGPYATRFLVEEAFESSENEAQISAGLLRERLPMAVLMTMYRHHKLYSNGDDPGEISEEDLKEQGVTLAEFIAKVNKEAVEDNEHVIFQKSVPSHILLAAEKLIESRKLPDYALSFVEFVELCEAKEKETGEPVLIQVSY